MMLLNLIDCSSYISNLVILSVRGSLVFFCHISTVVVFSSSLLIPLAKASLFREAFPQYQLSGLNFPQLFQ